MKANWLLWCRMLAPLVFAGTVLLGGWLRPVYDQLAQPISALTDTNAPNKALIDTLFTAYNLLIIGFGIGVIQRTTKLPHSRLSGVLAGVALVGAGMCGLMIQLYFPHDAGVRGATTVRGALHYVFTGLSAFTSAVAMLSTALWLRKQNDMLRYTIYTLITFVVVMVSSGLGAAATLSKFLLAGLIERLTMGVLLVWLFIIARQLVIAAVRTDDQAEKMRKLSSPRGRRLPL